MIKRSKKLVASIYMDVLSASIDMWTTYLLYLRGDGAVVDRAVLASHCHLDLLGKD